MWRFALAMLSVSGHHGHHGQQIIAPNKLSASAAIAKLEADNDPAWLAAKQEVYRSSSDILSQDAEEYGRGMRFRKLRQGPTADKTILLTIDDGPHPNYTPRLLQILRRYDVKATFFVVGSQAEKYPSLVRAEVGAGHIVGNHTYHHVSLVKLPDSFIAEEIKACGDVVRHITGHAPKYFRPPGGQYNDSVARIASNLGYVTVLWTDDPGDFLNPGTGTILEKTFSRIGPGGILLLHDGSQQTLDVLPTIIQTLTARGYRFVLPDEWTRKRLTLTRPISF